MSPAVSTTPAKLATRNASTARRSRPARPTAMSRELPKQSRSAEADRLCGAPAWRSLNRAVQRQPQSIVENATRRDRTLGAKTSQEHRFSCMAPRALMLRRASAAKSILVFNNSPRSLPKLQRCSLTHATSSSPSQTFRRCVGVKSWRTTHHERFNREIKRRTEVVGIFPDRDAAPRPVRSVVCEIHDECVTMRCAMTHELKHTKAGVVGIPRRLKRAS